MRVRLRPAHSPEKLAEIYAEPYDHTGSADHELRSQLTIQVGDWMLRDHRGAWDQKLKEENYPLGDQWEAMGYPTATIVDLSAGDAYIPKSVAALNDFADLILGDYCSGLGYSFDKPIEESIKHIDDCTLFLLNETLEHLDDPDAILRKIRGKSTMLVISTPINEPHDTGNLQHYWSWSTDDVLQMLSEAGWSKECVVELTLNTYHDFMIIGAV